MAHIPSVKINMAAKGRSKPNMSKAEKDFIRGYACCLANAISLEDWRRSQIGGGISDLDFRTAKIEPSDYKTITESKA